MCFFSKNKVVRYGVWAMAMIVVIVGTLWAVNKYINDKEFNEALAEDYDEKMMDAYPFVKTLADATYVQASMLENNALAANNVCSQQDYHDVLSALISQFYQTQQGRWVGLTLSQYDLFVSSYIYGIIGNTSIESRKSEVKAVWGLYYAYKNLKYPMEISCDSLLKVCDVSKKTIIENVGVLKKYERTDVALDSWRFPDTGKSMEIHRKYNERRNWPIQFLFGK